MYFPLKSFQFFFHNLFYKAQTFARIVPDVAQLVASKTAHNRYVHRVVDYPRSPFRPVRLCVGYPMRALPAVLWKLLSAYLADSAAACQCRKPLLLFILVHPLAPSAQSASPPPEGAPLLSALRIPRCRIRARFSAEDSRWLSCMGNRGLQPPSSSRSILFRRSCGLWCCTAALYAHSGGGSGCLLLLFLVCRAVLS